MRLLLCGLFLHAVWGCSDTQSENVATVRVRYWGCANTVYNDITFYLNSAQAAGRNTWTSRQGALHHLYYYQSGAYWAFGNDIIGSGSVEMYIIDSGPQPPTNGNWLQWCEASWSWPSFSVLVEAQPVSCTDCGLNKITPPGSNTCQCRSGQTPGIDGACTDCLSATFKPEPSDGACTLCPGNSSSAVGSVAITACACKPGYSGEDGGECTQCASGKKSVPM